MFGFKLTGGLVGVVAFAGLLLVYDGILRHSVRPPINVDFENET